MVQLKRRQPRFYRIHHCVALFLNAQFADHYFRARTDFYKNPGDEQKRGHCIRRCLETIPNRKLRGDCDSLRMTPVFFSAVDGDSALDGNYISLHLAAAVSAAAGENQEQATRGGQSEVCSPIL